MTRHQKITIVISITAIVVTLWGTLRKGDAAKPQPVVLSATIIPPDRDRAGSWHYGSEVIAFRPNTVEVASSDIENRIAYIATAAKALPAGLQVELDADIFPHDSFGETLAKERVALVRDLLVKVGVPEDKLRTVVRDERTQSITVHGINVRWSSPEL